MLTRDMTADDIGHQQTAADTAAVDALRLARVLPHADSGQFKHYATNRAELS